MQYTYPVEEYAKQLKAYNELEKISFAPTDSREYVLERLEERSAKKQVIAEIANTMIREYIGTFEKDPGALTDSDAELLERFYDSLINPATNREMDLGVEFRIARILKAYYQKTGRRHDYFRALQHCVECEKLLFFNHADAYIPSLYAEECLYLAQHLEEVPAEDRERFYSILYWITLNHEDDTLLGGDFHPVDVLVRVENYLKDHAGEDDPAYRKVREAYNIAQNSLNIILEHFLWIDRHGLPRDVERYRPLMERYYDILRNWLDHAPENAVTQRLSLSSMLLHTDCRLGRITPDELLDELTKLQAGGSDDEGPVVKATRLGKLNYHYLMLMVRLSGYDRETITELSRKRIKETLPRILKTTREVNNQRFNLYLLFFIMGTSYTSRFDEFANLILEMTVYSDKPLFVHTAMVRELSRAIFDEMIETVPEAFAGVEGRDADYIRTHKAEMRVLLDDCCMFHDVGKLYMLDIVENSMRNLTDDEFTIIKYHPPGFEIFSRNWVEQDERLHCIHDCCLTHHRWHDETRGYPDVPHTKNRPFSDIIAIADSIDAATDYLGRPYKHVKTIDELIAEDPARHVKF